MPSPDTPPNVVAIACRLATELEKLGQDYALGGAIALGYWAEPRGTIDVDLVLFVSPDKPSECVWILQEIGCDVNVAEAVASIREHSFCRVTYENCRIDVFLPSIDFYEAARQRRRRFQLGEQTVAVWDAESLCVFKMMFFRRKDIADIERILQVQQERLDRKWVREWLVGIYGQRDPRVAQWDELSSETESD